VVRLPDDDHPDLTQTITSKNRPGKLVRGSPLQGLRNGGLKLDHVASLGTSAAVNDIELDIFPFGQRSKPFVLDGGMMDENVNPLLILNETVTFPVVEPLHFAFCHDYLSLPGQVQESADRARDKKTGTLWLLLFSRALNYNSWPPICLKRQTPLKRWTEITRRLGVCQGHFCQDFRRGIGCLGKIG
jgi:hypothetical protein